MLVSVRTRPSASGWLNLGSFLLSFFSGCLRDLEVDVEAVETVFPKMTISVDPTGDLFHRSSFQFAWSRLRCSPPRNEASRFQHFEMFGNRWLRHVKWLYQFADGRLSFF